MKEKKQQTGPHPSPDFAEFVAELGHGQINQELTAELAKVTAAVEETGGSGTVTLTLKIKKERQMAVVVGDIRAKAPRAPLHASMFFIGANGELLREDPKQMNLKNLDSPALRTVGKDD